MRHGKFGFNYSYMEATPKRRGGFWNGSTMVTEAAPVSVADAESFFWSVAADDSSYLTGWKNNYINYYEGGALVLTVPLGTDESFMAQDQKNPRVLYTVLRPFSDAPTRKYTISQDDGGVWSFTSVDFPLVGTWEYDDQTLIKVFDTITPFTAMDPSNNLRLLAR